MESTRGTGGKKEKEQPPAAARWIFFANFALNTNPRLQDALRDAIRDVAELDYKAIAQHFNRQFVKMTLPS